MASTNAGAKPSAAAALAPPPRPTQQLPVTLKDKAKEKEMLPEQEPSEDEEDSNDEGEDDESEDDEEEEEPRLKYQRLGASVIEILKRDTASVLAVHSRFLALGTGWGVVYLLDFNGNEIRRFTAHEKAVKCLSIDTPGEFIASCADDGKVVIHNLYSKETQTHTFDRSVSHVALDPDFSKTKNNQFVCGGKAGKLIHSEKGFWFGSNETVIHEGEGPIHSISWGHNVIAWANDIGVKMYDTVTRERITYIDRPRGSPRPELYRCCLTWQDEDTIIVGWADSVKIGRIRTRAQPVEGLPMRFVEIVAMFQTDFFLCGVAPFGNELMLLGFNEEPDPETKKSQRPELRIVTRENVELSSEAVTIPGFENYRALDYRLDHSSADNLFYIVSPKDIAIAKPRDLDDRITWLLERERYEEALDAAEGHEKELKKHDMVKIGGRYLDYLFTQPSGPQKAAALCPKILKGDEKLWEQWIYTFTRKGHLRAIGPFIPVRNPRLKDVVYEMVLSYFLNHDPAGFLKMVNEWPHEIYSLQSIITLVEEKTRTTVAHPNLTIALAKLYTYDKQYDKTLHIYLQLGHGNVFELIRQYDLYTSIGDKVLELMRFDESQATELLINCIDRVTVNRVVQQLKSEPRMQLKYLDSLFHKESRNKESGNQAGKDFHNVQVKLYAEYDPSRLYDFLEKSNYWDLEIALSVCKEFKLWREVVFILGRMGNIEEALNLMVDKVGDVKQAIEFVQKQNDEKLWDDLIAKAIRNPVFVSGLLENVGTHINPLKLIEKIPKGMEIIGLRDRLVKIINDYLLQMSLSQGCQEVLKADVISLVNRLNKGNKKAVRIEAEAKCALSNTPLVNASKKKTVITFFCQHSFIEEELLKALAPAAPLARPLSGPVDASAANLYCPICRQNAENKVERRVRGPRR